jgi:hypothetical protein
MLNYNSNVTKNNRHATNLFPQQTQGGEDQSILSFKPGLEKHRNENDGKLIA